MSGLTRDDINHILNLIDGSDFNELKLEMGDVKLELRRRGAGAASAPAAPEAPAANPVAAAASAPQPAAAAPAPAGGGSDVPAPLLGTFYHAPKPGDPVFVQVGDTVTEDTVIGIIEVMKLMNQVKAGVAGTVTEIVAPNGELVEHGQTLIRVQPA
ncbi:acetyl-CoA carboxylase biotin carboxyl carrier protein [Thalassovita sp.]|jgi:acetyl-CoA carboxylase biotin carboxyl carrier protein|uniref:acetyl-CoA carboxylase biotin carboxyl carrier protein n=1 Tax=Thalassovita sp. TaxID=1979401 RepID=UPI003B5C9554